MEVLDSLVSRGEKKNKVDNALFKSCIFDQVIQEGQKKHCFCALEEMKENIPAPL